MNFRQNQNVSWNLVDAPAAPTGEGSLGMDVDNGAYWYPSPVIDYFPLYEFSDLPLETGDNDRNSSPQTVYPSAMVSDVFSSPSHAYLTPPLSAQNSPAQTHKLETQEEMSVEVSTQFYPGNPEIIFAPDMVLCSEDDVLFYLNSHILASAGFKLSSQLPLQEVCIANGPSPLLQGSLTKLPDSSSTLSMIFNVVHGLSCTSFPSSLDAVSQAISRMTVYNLSPSSFIRPGTPIYAFLVCQYAPLEPLKLYTFAAQHSIESLAMDVSSHLLGFNLSQITDEMVIAMGPVYLKRLFFMHKGRTERLKKILAVAPSLHIGERKGCNHADQAELRRKWTFLAATLAWDAKPDISPHMIKDHLRLTGEAISCHNCRDSWRDRTNECGTEWATIKFTI